jgi:hypothetical protein
MKVELAVDALEMAVVLRRPAGPVIVHADRGPRKPAPITQVSSRVDPSQPRRLDGPGRVRHGQRRDGIVVPPDPEERPEPSPDLILTRGVAVRDRVVDGPHGQRPGPLARAGQDDPRCRGAEARRHALVEAASVITPVNQSRGKPDQRLHEHEHEIDRRARQLRKKWNR